MLRSHSSWGGSEIQSARLVRFQLQISRSAMNVYLTPLNYLAQPFFVSSKPSNSRLAFAPASVSSRCGCPFSTV